MKANELRIGNYTLFNNFLQPERVVIVDGRFLLPFNKTESEINNYYQPIPLTKEWLLKLNCSNNFLRKDIEGYFVWFNGEKIYVKYVHQLQNLYFALTGEDLSID